MATGLADGTAPSTIARRLGVGFATVGRIAGGTVTTGLTSNTVWTLKTPKPYAR
jgi:hypothetical protein